MRTELCEFMNGASVEFVAEFIQYGKMNFVGKDEFVNPITQLIIPIEIYDPEIPISPIAYMNKTTLVRPISINGIPINNITEMWIVQCLSSFPDGNLFKRGDKLQAYGHIRSYTRRNGTLDFCFVPYSAITKLK